MKDFRISSDVFLELLEPLSPVINPNHTIPVLRCVKIEIFEKKIYVTGDNNEINCVNSAKIGAEIKLSICVNYAMLLSILKSIKEQRITLKTDKKSLYIVHAKGDFNIPLDDIREFPKNELVKFDKKASVNGKQLKSALRVANKFILNIDLDPTSNISIQVGKKMVIRSTNKVCLFEEKIKGKGDKAMLLINGRSSTAVYNLFEDEEVEMQFNHNKIFFGFQNRQITIVQQHGDFPLAMFNKIIGSIDKAEPLDVDYEAFGTSLKRSSILSNKKDNTVRLELGTKSVKFVCDNQEMSSKSQEEIAARFKANRVVGYNSKFLIEILSVFDNKARFYVDEKGCFCIKSKKKNGLMAPLILN